MECTCCGESVTMGAEGWMDILNRNEVYVDDKGLYFGPKSLCGGVNVHTAVRQGAGAVRMASLIPSLSMFI